MKLPSFQFYPGDWQKDPQLKFCSLSAQGLLINLLCSLFEMKHRGRFCKADGKTPYDDYAIIGMVACGREQEKLSALKELEEHEVLKRDQYGVLYSSRMVKDEQNRLAKIRGGEASQAKQRAERQQEVQQNAQQNDEQNAKSSSSSSTSTSVVKEEVVEEETAIPAEAETVGKPWKCTDGEWRMPKAWYEALAATYPQIDFTQAMKEARRWLDAKPDRIRPVADMPEFVRNWIHTESQKRAYQSANGRKQPRSKPPQSQPQKAVDVYGRYK